MTYANGIFGNTIVGSCLDPDGEHGFAYDGATWTQLDCPAGGGTNACGIWNNYVVGWYVPTGSQSVSGFLYDGSTWTSLRYPSSIETRALGVFEDRIVGYYEDSSYKWHGFLFDGQQPQGQQWTSLDYPGGYGTQTYASGIWGNAIVGHYWRSAQFRGFIYDGSTWQSILDPGAEITGLHGIYEDRIIGISHGPGDTERNFLLSGTTWTYLDCPLGTSFLATGISGDRIVGTYRLTPTGEDHSFLLTIPEPASLALLALAAVPALRCRRLR